MQDRMATAESLLASAQQERKAQDRTRAQTLAALAVARRELARLAPETQWAEPPASVPDWHSDSPYFWATKESLHELGLKSFAGDGTLTSEMASILAIDEPTRRKINDQMARAVADFQALQAANVKLSDEASRIKKLYEDWARADAEVARRQAELRAEFRAEFPSLFANDPPQPDQPLQPRAVDGPVVTVEVPRLPEQNASLRDQIGQILEQSLGPQRRSLITDLGGDWLNSWAVSDRGRMTVCGWAVRDRGQITVSVMRHADGKFMVVGPIGGFEDDIPATDVPQHIPGYLLPFFAGILNPPAADGPVADP
jgi:hypothetical protein